MKRLLALALILSGISAYAQVQIGTTKKRKTNPYTFNLIFTPQLFLHNANLQNDGIYPETISTKNTGGFRIGAEIEKRSRRNGFIMDLGITYGFERQFINIAYDNLVFYDPESAATLLQLGSFNNNYTTNTTYLDIHFNAGYIFPVKILKGWQPVIKAGVFLRTYYQLYQKTPDIGIQFIKNDTLFSGPISVQTIAFGDNGTYTTFAKLMQLYAGVTKNLHYKFLKNINIGIEVTRTLSSFSNGNIFGGYADVRSYNLNRREKYLSGDEYEAKDYAIGLRLSAGLWYK